MNRKGLFDTPKVQVTTDGSYSYASGTGRLPGRLTAERRPASTEHQG